MTADDGAAASPIRPHFEVALALLAMDQSDFETACRLAESAETLCRRANNRPALAKALNVLASSAMLRGDNDTAQRYFEDLRCCPDDLAAALAAFRGLGSVAHRRGCHAPRCWRASSADRSLPGRFAQCSRAGRDRRRSVQAGVRRRACAYRRRGGDVRLARSGLGRSARGRRGAIGRRRGRRGGSRPLMSTYPGSRVTFGSHLRCHRLRGSTYVPTTANASG